MRKHGIALGALMALLLAMSTETHAKKPPEPPPDPVDSGVIYFLLEGTPTSMDPNGSGRATVPAGKASIGLHGGERWFLQWRPLGGEDYPNGFPRYGLYAVSESEVAVLLNVDRIDDAGGNPVAYIEPSSISGVDEDSRANEAWANDDDVTDGKVCYGAKKWVKDGAGDWVVDEWGLYVVVLDPDEMAYHTPAVPTRIPVPVELHGASNPDNQHQGFVNAGVTWAPTGTSFVYMRYDPNEGLWRADCEGSSWSVTQLTTDSCAGVNWSPVGDKLVFTAAGSITTMNADGTGRTIIIEPKSKGRVSEHIGPAFWSPAATHLVYCRRTSDKLTYALISADVYRAKADGSDKTDLTDDTDAYAFYPLRWRAE